MSRFNEKEILISKISAIKIDCTYISFDSSVEGAVKSATLDRFDQERCGMLDITVNRLFNYENIFIISIKSGTKEKFEEEFHFAFSSKAFVCDNEENLTHRVEFATDVEISRLEVKILISGTEFLNNKYVYNSDHFSKIIKFDTIKNNINMIERKERKNNKGNAEIKIIDYLSLISKIIVKNGKAKSLKIKAGDFK